MHVLKIFSRTKGRNTEVVVEGSEYGSIITSTASATVVLVPVFPTNWPALLTPTTVDDVTKKETLLACNKLNDSASLQTYYKGFWDLLYSESKAIALHDKLFKWLQNVDSIRTISSSVLATHNHLHKCTQTHTNNNR